MSKIRSELREDYDTLRTMRDELKVQAHLAASEAKDYFEEIEHKWNHAEAKLRRLGEESLESAENVGGALELALDEIRDGYTNLKKRLTDL